MTKQAEEQTAGDDPDAEWEDKPADAFSRCLNCSAPADETFCADCTHA